MTHNCPLCETVIPVTLNIPCPLCGSQLAIKTNKKFGTKFIGCTGFTTELKCRWAMSVPRYMIYAADIGEVYTRFKREGANINPRRGPLRKITLLDETPIDNLTG